VGEYFIVILVFEVLSFVSKNGILLLFFFKKLEEILVLLLVNVQHLIVNQPSCKNGSCEVESSGTVILNLDVLDEILIILVFRGRIKILHEGHELLI
jgi:hypothetical protein